MMNSASSRASGERSKVVFVPKYGKATCRGTVRNKEIEEFISKNSLQRVFVDDPNYWYGGVNGLMLVTSAMGDVGPSCLITPETSLMSLSNAYSDLVKERIAIDTHELSNETLEQLLAALTSASSVDHPRGEDIILLQRPACGRGGTPLGKQKSTLHIPGPLANHKKNISMMNKLCEKENITCLISNAIEQKFCNTIVMKPAAVEVVTLLPVAPKAINLICQYCNANTEDRQREYDYCVRSNLNNPFVEAVFMLNEPSITIPEEFKTHPKCNIVEIGEWLTYKKAFEFAAKFLQNKVCGLVNLDIFLDHKSDWSNLSKVLYSTKNMVFCQSRHEYDGKGISTKDPSLQKLFYCNAQDGWFFLGGVMKQSTIDTCDFKIGLAGCDNAIADRLYNANMVLINSPNVYKIHHYDICRSKTGANYMKFVRTQKNNTHPEKNGYRLLPDIDAFSVDGESMLKKALEFFKSEMVVPDHVLKLSVTEQYILVCTLFTSTLKLNND